MYLLYLDESGTHPSADRVVVGGVAVFERAAYWLKRDLSETVSRYLPHERQHIPIHAPRLRTKGPRGLPGRLRRRRCGGAPPPPRRVLLHPAHVPAPGPLRDRRGQGRGGVRRRLPGRVRGRRQPVRPHARPLPRRQPHPARGGHHVGVEHPAGTRSGPPAVGLGRHPVGPHPEPVRGPPVRIQVTHAAAPGGGARDQRGLGGATRRGSPGTSTRCCRSSTARGRGSTA